jgi:outer membrane protein OmpU
MIRTSSKSIGGKFKGDTMKKILLGTTAVVALASMSTEAFAADKIKLGLGGFMKHYVGVSNHDEVAPSANNVTRAVKLQQYANTEVYFRGATTLDNGLNVSVDIQREGDKSTTGRNDVSSLTVSSDALGALTVGSTNHAGDDMLIRVPNAGSFDWGDTDRFGAVATSAGAATAGFSTSSSSDISDMGDNTGKLKYISPSFSGFTVYASYTAAEGLDGSNITAGGGAERNTTGIDGSTYGIAYEGEVAGASIAADLTQFRSNGTYNVTHGGLNVGMAGFTVGGGYSDFNDDVSSAGANDGKAWELGVSYETGPYSLSAGYMVAKNKGAVATTGDNKDTKWNLAATYDMGAGVALAANYFHSTADAEGAGSTTKTTVSGVIAGIEVGF